MHGDTYEKTQQAADRLLKQGVKPTQQRIREELGKGSISTINKALGDWWASLGDRLSKQSQLPEIPASIAEIVQTLWERSVAESGRIYEQERLRNRDELKRARALMASNREGLEEEKSLLLQRLDDAYQSVSELQQQVSHLQQEQAASEKGSLELQKTCTEMERENRTLAATVKHLEQQLASQLEPSAREAQLQQENANLRRALERLDRQRG